MQLFELRRAGLAQPLEYDHLAVHDIDTGLEEPRERQPTARFGALGDGVGDHEGLKALILKVDCGLRDADVRFNAAHHHLRPALAPKFMQPLTQGIAFRTQNSTFSMTDPA